MRESRLGRWAFAATTVWSLAVLIAHSDAGVAFPTWMILFALTILVVVWSSIGLGLAVLEAARESGDVRLASAVWTKSLACVALTFAALWLMVPLRARLFLSGPALRQSTAYLAALPSERLHSSPPWIGLFRVREFAQYEGELRFLTSACGFVDTCGIVYSPGGRPPNRGEDSFQHIYGEWWHWRQSW
ncbi:MAG TPA: hypothetical protein VFJ02_01865 [Vicinamibacterales bacterium]|nr:hypothetical protein [Vicinamibacterales bacterium]